MLVARLRPSYRARWACCRMCSARVMYALSRDQGALSPHASIVHCRDISPMLRHRKSHIPGISIATESLEKSVARVAQACHAHPTPYRVRKPTLWFATEKHHVTTAPLEFLSRHKVLCSDRNVPPMGKLFRDIRRSLSRPKPNPAPNPVPTLKSCHDIEFLSRHRAEKPLSRQRRPLSRPKPPSM